MKSKKEDIKNFLKGEVNYNLDKLNLLKKSVKQQSEMRQKICEACPILNKEKGKCDPEREIDGKQGCGCKYPDLTYAPEKECPLKKWGKMQNFKS